MRTASERRYLSVEAGWNSRLDPLQAAILGEKLADLDARNARRSALARRYRDGLEGLPGLVLPVADDSAAHHLFVVQVENRGRLRERLAGRGIGTLVHYPTPIHRHPAYEVLGRGPSRSK